MLPSQLAACLVFRCVALSCAQRADRQTDRQTEGQTSRQAGSSLLLLLLLVPPRLPAETQRAAHIQILSASVFLKINPAKVTAGREATCLRSPTPEACN